MKNEMGCMYTRSLLLLLLLLLLQRELTSTPWEDELEKKLQAVQQEVEELSHVLLQQQRIETPENLRPDTNLLQLQQQQQQQQPVSPLNPAEGTASNSKSSSSSSSSKTGVLPPQGVAAALQQEIEELLQSSLYTPDDPLIKALEEAKRQAHK